MTGGSGGLWMIRVSVGLLMTGDLQVCGRLGYL